MHPQPVCAHLCHQGWSKRVGGPLQLLSQGQCASDTHLVLAAENYTPFPRSWHLATDSGEQSRKLQALYKFSHSKFLSGDIKSHFSCISNEAMSKLVNCHLSPCFLNILSLNSHSINLCFQLYFPQPHADLVCINFPFHINQI